MTEPTRPDGTRSTAGEARGSFVPDGELPQLTGALERRLRLVRPLGDGGMGTVYEVEHLVTKHRRALKILHREQAARPEVVQRFLREASVAGKLRSPNVVETFDAGVLEDGRPFVLMELVPGKSLAALAEDGLGKEPERVVRLLVQVCEGMSIAHAKGVVHRDLKPENLIVTPEEHVKILDFGISKFLEPEDSTSKVTREGALLGTPHYMSPEQAMGRPVDTKTDVYALGAIGYELLAGVPPFEAQMLPELLVKIHMGEHEPLSAAAPHVAPGLAAVLERAMHKDPAQRTQTMDALREALAPYRERTAARREDGATVDVALPQRAGAKPKSSISIDIGEEETDVAPRAARELAATVAADGVLPAASVVDESPAPLDAKPKSVPPPATAPLPNATIAERAGATAPDAPAPPRARTATWVAIGIALVALAGLSLWAVATYGGTAHGAGPSATITHVEPPVQHAPPEQHLPPTPPTPPQQATPPAQTNVPPTTPPPTTPHGHGHGHGNDPIGIDRHNPFN